ncbi:hypothetical protein KJQ80_02590 [Campylobacter upsaliensis]|uniref:hypothetical protein n=1 Tax=Campylobacter upsaliensis TaxID=28080 RepID=UPI00130BDA23|nr:hypothetical protein [Campylobacter upsaliensis]MBT0800137.1 hypothetical protein [Campylobacter upsaliensis]
MPFIHPAPSLLAGWSAPAPRGFFRSKHNFLSALPRDQRLHERTLSPLAKSSFKTSFCASCMLPATTIPFQIKPYELQCVFK